MIGIFSCDGEKSYFPEEILAQFLRPLKLAAESKLNKKVDQAVVTVPASYNDAQRRATRDAVSIAGFEGVRLLNEPSAAAIAYSFKNKVPSNRFTS